MKRTEVGYNTWFKNHSVRSIDQNECEIIINDVDRNRPQEEGKGEKGYGEWFLKHSIDKKPIDYKEEEPPLDEKLKKTEVRYNTWFKNHSVRSVD